MNRYLCFVLGAIAGGLATFGVLSRKERQPDIYMIDIYQNDSESSDSQDSADAAPILSTTEDESCADS